MGTFVIHVDGGFVNLFFVIHMLKLRLWPQFMHLVISITDLNKESNKLIGPVSKEISQKCEFFLGFWAM